MANEGVGAVSEPFTYGCELEWSDIDRRIDIPKELGSWEGPKVAGFYMGSEIDIVNTQGMWRGHATDPLCISCPVGGEIHTVPSYTIQSQFFRIMRLIELFPKLGVACPNHGHIHVKVPGLKTDLKVLQNFFKYLERNENDLIRLTSGYDEKEGDYVLSSDLPSWAKSYFLVGDAKHISPSLYKSVAEARTIEEALEYIATIPCYNWYWHRDEGEETPGSHRTAVNMFNLTKGDTIEFRVWRASLNPMEIWSTLYFTQEFVHQAIKGEQGASVEEIFAAGRYEFPKLNFDPFLAESWVNTRKEKGRCGPFKKSFSSATFISNDPIETEERDYDAFDRGLISILELCENYRAGRDIEYLRYPDVGDMDVTEAYKEKPVCHDSCTNRSTQLR